MLQYTDTEIIKDFFPMDTPRNGQIGVIQKILKAFKSGKKIVILDLPVGAGKSVIAKTIANMFDTACYATSQIILQDQLIADFGENGKFKKGPPMVHLKGRSNYPCVYTDLAKDLSTSERIKYSDKNCATGFCKIKGSSMCGECIDDNAPEEYAIENNKCPYWARVDQFLDSPSGLINFKAYLYQKSFSKYFWLYKPELLIVDEAHNLEKELLDFVGITFNDKLLTPILGKKLPKFNTPEDYKKWFVESDIIKNLQAEVAIAKAQERMKTVEEIEELSGKITKFLAEDDLSNWVVKVDDSFKSNVRVDLKPIFVRDQAKKLIFNQADHIIMMSATILSPDVMCDSLGLKKDEIEYISMPSTFPVENRKINYIPVGSMSYKAKASTMPKMLEAVYELCEMHENEKGIIHTHNFQIAEAIMNNAPKELRKRLLFQRNFSSKEEMLEKHAKSTDTVIVAPAMHEGLDLKEDLSRFQIICKIPYPNFMDDPQLKRRMDLNQNYYNWLTCLKICQCYGRSIRSETDKAETYILDSDFSRLLSNSRNMLPIWFTEAIVN